MSRVSAHHRLRHGYARTWAVFGRSCVLILLALTAVALYLDRSAGTALRKQEHLMVAVRQTRGLVVFEAYERSWPLQWKPRPTAIVVLRVIDWIDGTALWEIEATSPQRVVIAYGQVPTGFTQTIPGSGGPVPLKAGASYGVTVHSAQGSAVTTFNKLLTKVAR